MLYDIIVCFLLAVVSVGVCCTTALAWLILKAVGELQAHIMNPMRIIIPED